MYITSSQVQYIHSLAVLISYRYGEFVWDRYVDPTPSDFENGINSPTMSGGIMAVDKEYFTELGGYDTDMLIYGGESLEFSFLTWMCGGKIKVMPPAYA